MKSQQELLLDEVLSELNDFDNEDVDLGDGIKLKPSQCYRFSFYPNPHFLFNTNCPEELQGKVLTIFRKHFKEII